MTLIRFIAILSVQVALMWLGSVSAASAQSDPAPAVTFSAIRDAVPGRCYDALTTAPDAANPNLLRIGINTGTIPGTFGTNAGCYASDGSGSAGLTVDTIAFVATAPEGYYISRITFSQTGATSGSRGGRGFLSASWVVGDDARPAAASGVSGVDLTGQNKTVVPVKFTTFLAAAGGTVRSGSATVTGPSALVELLPLVGEPPPPPPPPPPTPAPVLNAASPSILTAGGPAFSLTLSGSSIVSGSVVQWNGSNRPTTAVSSTQLRATISAADIAVAGAADVRVFNPPSGHYVPADGGLSDPLTITINPAPTPNPVPVATSLEPASAIVGLGSITLTVNGTNFVPGAVARWNGVNRSTTFVSPTQLRATLSVTDLFVAGSFTVTVFNPATGFNPPPDGGLSNGLTFTVTEVPPPPPPAPGPVPVAAHGNVNDGRGKEWRQLTQTTSVSPAQLTAHCPADGPTPYGCSGMAGTVDLTDWVWADAPQVFELFSYFTTGVNPTTPSVGGVVYTPAASQFHGLFALTQSISGCTTYQGCFDFRAVAGRSSSRDLSETPIGGSVALSSNQFGELEGFFSVAAVTDLAPRGAFMWRPTGLGTGAAHAYNDAGQSPSQFGGTAFNVMANDWVGGIQASAANAVATMAIEPSPPTDHIVLTGDGAVTVLSGALAGTYSFTYRLCPTGSSTGCDEATVSVLVRSYVLNAVNDQATASFSAGGTPIANVLANDTLNGQAATVGVVSLMFVSSTHAGITLDTTTGAVRVAPGTSAGPHSLIYQVCERANASNCATATATLTSVVVDAVNDVFPKLSKDGATSPSVLANDRVNGAVATAATVTLSLVTALPAHVTLDTTTGRFIITDGVESGDFPVTYRICEIGSVSNCDTASLTLEISGSAE